MGEDIKYNGPEMNVRKLLILFLTAALILVLFLTRNSYKSSAPEVDEEETVEITPREFIYISPFDSLFRLYADTVCDWKMLAAIAYVESKFDTAAKSGRGAQGIMQIMPSTYNQLKSKIGIPDSVERSVETDIRVAVRYIDDLGQLFYFINDKERMNYILGSYNGGSNHIFDAMRVARKKGINRYSWNSLSPVLASLSDPEVYNDSICLYGAFNATETLQYVRRVNRKYNEYKSRELMFMALEKLAENNKE